MNPPHQGHRWRNPGMPAPRRMLPIHHARERSIVATVMLDVRRAFGAAYLKRKRFGSSADELLLLAAVFVGQAEGRPMATAKVAEYAGVARPSAIRQRGLMEKSGPIPDHVVNSAAVMKAATASRKRIRRSAAAIGGGIKAD